jgi:hypothetical protein
VKQRSLHLRGTGAVACVQLLEIVSGGCGDKWPYYDVTYCHFHFEIIQFSSQEVLKEQFTEYCLVIYGKFERGICPLSEASRCYFEEYAPDIYFL